MSVYNQPTSNIQSDVPGGPLVSEHPGPGSTIANPLVQGLQYVVNALAPDHSDEANESFSDSSSSYYSLSPTSSSSSLSSEGDALSVDAYLQSDGADAEGTHDPALHPSEEEVRDDILDASDEILDPEEVMLDAECHPNAFDYEIDDFAPFMKPGIFTSNFVEMLNSETGAYPSDPSRRRRHAFDSDYWNDALSFENARVAHAVKWAKVERLARKWAALQHRREAAEREQDGCLQMSYEEAELEMEEKERYLYLLEGAREMYRQQKLREAAAHEDQRLQQEYLEIRLSCSQCLMSDLRRTLEDTRACRAGLISEEEYTARRLADSPVNYHYTRDRTIRSRSNDNHFHPYSRSTKVTRSNNRHSNAIEELDDPYGKLLTAGRYAFKIYHDTWDRLVTPGNEVALTFRTVPWPLITSPYTPVEITKSRVWEFLCRGLFDGSGLRAKQRRFVLEEELKRWHPDSIETWIIPCIIDESELAAVREAATAVHGALVLLIALK